MTMVNQGQTIVSPSGKLMIVHHRAYIDRFGCYCVEGAIRNISQEPSLKAEIKIDYLDIDNRLIDTEIDTTVRALTKGTTVAFHTMYSGRQRGKIKSYQIYPDENN
jgi:hypothetical protein